MARLKVGSWVVYFAVGAVLAVAVLPISNWSFRNQVDMLLGRFRAMSLDSDAAWVEAGGLFDRSRWQSQTREDELAVALPSMRSPTHSEIEREHREPGFRSRLQALEAFVDRHPDDLDGSAHLARLLTQIVTVPRLDRPATPLSPYERERERLAAAKLLEVAAQGAGLDPANAYFPTMRAIALYTLGRKTEARDELVRASRLDTHDDRVFRELDLLVSTVEKNNGFRGQALRTSLAASTVFPHFASVGNLVERIAAEAPPEGRLLVKWSLYRHQYVMARNSSSVIGILVGNGGMGLALLPRPEYPKGMSRKDREAKVDRAAREFGARLHAAGVETRGMDPAKMHDEVVRLAAAGTDVVRASPGWDMPYLTDPFLAAHLGARALMLMLGLVPAYLGLSWWAKRRPQAFERGRGVLCCFLLGVSVFWLSLANALRFQEPISASPVMAALGLTILYGVLLAMALGGASERATLAVFGVAAGIGFVPFAVLPYAAAVPFCLANLGLVLLAWRAPTWNVASFLLAVAATLGTGAVFWDPIFTHLGWAAILLAVLPGACALCLGSARSLRAVGSGAALLLTLAYLGTTGWDVAEDAKYGRLNATFFHEADLARAAAGLPKLGAP